MSDTECIVCDFCKDYNHDDDFYACDVCSNSACRCCWRNNKGTHDVAVIKDCILCSNRVCKNHIQYLPIRKDLVDVSDYMWDDVMETYDWNEYCYDDKNDVDVVRLCYKKGCKSFKFSYLSDETNIKDRKLYLMLVHNLEDDVSSED